MWKAVVSLVVLSGPVLGQEPRAPSPVVSAAKQRANLMKAATRAASGRQWQRARVLLVEAKPFFPDEKSFFEATKAIFQDLRTEFGCRLGSLERDPVGLYTLLLVVTPEDDDYHQKAKIRLQELVMQ